MPDFLFFIYIFLLQQSLSHSVALGWVWWCHQNSVQQPPTPGLRWSSSLSLPRGWNHGASHDTQRISLHNCCLLLRFIFKAWTLTYIGKLLFFNWVLNRKLQHMKLKSLSTKIMNLIAFYEAWKDFSLLLWSHVSLAITRINSSSQFPFVNILSLYICTKRTFKNMHRKFTKFQK